MDYFYDGQIRRYVTQFMRFFIGFKYQDGGGSQTHVPVVYGDMTRQVASIIRENSENKMITVPKISCYITGLELDKTRLADPTFVSKMNIRERDYDLVNGQPVYKQNQGGNYTVERLMPTPFNLRMKADLYTSNTDQKLQLMEQILVFFNPSFEIQTTDNYIDWTSLSVVNLENISFTSRSIPAGTDSDIDVASMEFSMPVYITPPAKVKKLGVVHSVITNIFTETGDIVSLENLTLNVDAQATVYTTVTQFGVLLLKNNSGESNDYNVSIVDVNEAVLGTGIEVPAKQGARIEWDRVLPLYGSYKPGISQIFFQQSNGVEVGGTFSVNPIDPTYLVVNIDDKPSNTVLASAYRSSNSLGTIDAIINPQTFNPISTFGNGASIPVGQRYLMLEGVNLSSNVGGLMKYGQDPTDGSSRDTYDGPDGWKNLNGSDPVIKDNSIVEWTGSSWSMVLDPDDVSELIYITNLKTGIQYKLENGQWLKSFEGEYLAGTWRFDLNP